MISDAPNQNDDVDDNDRNAKCDEYGQFDGDDEKDLKKMEINLHSYKLTSATTIA